MSYSENDNFLDTEMIEQEIRNSIFVECVTILELVVWKAAAKAATLQEKPGTLRGDTEGWKAKKCETRRSPAIQIVMQNTLLFLEKP